VGKNIRTEKTHMRTKGDIPKKLLKKYKNSESLICKTGICREAVDQLL
jgi:hypothetical protein